VDATAMEGKFNASITSLIEAHPALGTRKGANKPDYFGR
jgi:hypothetical protein